MALRDLIDNWARNGLTDRELYNDEYDRKIKLLTKDLGEICDIIDTMITGSTSVIPDTGLTIWGTPVSGQIGYMTAVNTVLALAQANAEATSRVYGVYFGTANSVYVDGIIPVLFESGLTLTSGDRIYLSSTTAGRATNIAPSASGEVVVELGILKTNSGYDSMSGSALPVNWDPNDPVLIP